MRGGVDIVESQSTCPFQAFARHRLHARGGEMAGAGLSVQERGIVLHRTLAAFWQDVLDSRFHGYTDSYTQVNGAFGVKWPGDKITTTVKLPEVGIRGLSKVT